MKKLQTLNSQVSDYQQLGQQITAMLQWIKHTDNTLNARLKDNVYADDVPAEVDVRDRIDLFRRKSCFFYVEITWRISTI
jgi:hypothetical protein